MCMAAWGILVPVSETPKGSPERDWYPRKSKVGIIPWVGEANRQMATWRRIRQMLISQHGTKREISVSGDNDTRNSHFPASRIHLAHLTLL